MENLYIPTNDPKSKVNQTNGGVTAPLVSTLAISSSANALTPSISVPAATGNRTTSQFGQSFINTPSGLGATINLDSWAFGIQDTVDNRNAALASTLTIRLGVGNTGSIIGQSSTVNDASTLGGNRLATWTFTGGLQIIDNATYTAVITPSLTYRVNNINPYANGSVVVGTTTVPGEDAVFQGTFSNVTPVPFEFSPALGVVALGAGFVIKKKLSQKAK